jgi:lipopolysaccharide transport system ATP-binding protein
LEVVMMEPAIRAAGLGKQYRIGQRRPGHTTLREAVMSTLARPFLRADGASRVPPADDTIWALRDVSFDIQHGEVVGLIGRNGAGKSTLLKILSRIVEPTTGEVDLYGRVGSLLEVGTGFHLELTGRENIYLNGSILGMKRREIEAKFTEIVDFAEVGVFIDTPVKHYSSGMYMRLAFAVAAHLDPDILIIDEVLAVGDSHFQQKCLRKMHEVSRAGRTVLFVSHDMAAISRLCDRALLFEGGRLVQDGATADVVRRYVQEGIGTTAAREWQDPRLAHPEAIVRLHAVRVRETNGDVVETVDVHDPVVIEVEYEVLEDGHIIVADLQFRNDDGVTLFGTGDHDQWRRRPRGRYTSTVWIPGDLLAEGLHFVTAGCSAREPYRPQFRETDAVAFQVVDKSTTGSFRAEDAGRLVGVVRPALRWSTTRTRDPDHRP